VRDKNNYIYITNKNNNEIVKPNRMMSLFGRPTPESQSTELLMFPEKEDMILKEDIIFEYINLLQRITKIYPSLTNKEFIYVLINVLSSFDEFQQFINTFTTKLSMVFRSTFDTVEKLFVKKYLKNYGYTIDSLIPRPIDELPDKKLSDLINQQTILIDVIDGDLIINIYTLYFITIKSKKPIGDFEITSDVNEDLPFIISVAICKKTINVTRSNYDLSFKYYWLINTESKSAFKQVIEYSIIKLNQDLNLIIESQLKTITDTEISGLLEQEILELNTLSQQLNHFNFRKNILNYVKKFEFIFKEILDPAYNKNTGIFNETRIDIQKINDYLIDHGLREIIQKIHQNIIEYYYFSRVLHDTEDMRSGITSSVKKSIFGENKGNADMIKRKGLYNLSKYEEEARREDSERLEKYREANEPDKPAQIYSTFVNKEMPFEQKPTMPFVMPKSSIIGNPNHDLDDLDDYNLQDLPAVNQKLAPQESPALNSGLPIAKPSFLGYNHTVNDDDEELKDVKLVGGKTKRRIKKIKKTRRKKGNTKKYKRRPQFKIV
jgi:hypothetical protein